MKIKKYLLTIILFAIAYAYACTSSVLQTHEGYVYLRSLQFAMPIQSQVIAIPRNYSFSGITPDNKPDGLKWKSKYAVIGMNALNTNIIADGTNEVGLTGGMLYFPKYAKYQTIESDQDRANSIAGYQVLLWILTNFKNIDEVKQSIKNIVVVNTKLKNIPLPLHYIIHDTNGKSIAIEYDKRGLNVYNNPIHAFTNAPNFEFHLTNFGQYADMTSAVGNTTTINNYQFGPDSTGWDSIGLPGGFDSISRFVRAGFITNNINQPAAMPKTQYDGVMTAFRVLNMFDFPVGIDANSKSFSPTGEFDVNEWVSVADMKNHAYYIRTYEDSAIRTLSFKDFDPNGKQISTYNINSKETIYSLKGCKE